MLILQDEATKLPENLEKTFRIQARRKQVAGQLGCCIEVERKRMDYLMIIVPLKLALVIYIAYVLFH